MVMNGCADSIRNVYFYFDHYLLEEHFTKLKLLTEYYRFHNEIPRLFMLPVSDIMNNYHDKKRRIEYFRIVREIEDENKKNPGKPPKEIVGDKPDARKDSAEFSQRSGCEKEEKFYGNLLDDITLEQKKNISITLQELNQKLEEVVFGSKTKNLQDELDQNLKQNKQINDEEDKLNKFLAFLNEKDQKEEQKKFSFRKKKNLKLDEDILKSEQITNGPLTVQPQTQNQFQFIDSTRKTSKAGDCINLPKSARNSNQPINNLNSPFFLSETLFQKLQIQQQQFLKDARNLEQKKQLSNQKKGAKQMDKLSPRGNSSSSIQKQIQSPMNYAQKQQQCSKQQILSQQIQQSIKQHLLTKQQPKQLIKQQSANNIMKLPMQQQGFQGSQESYQADGIQIMSAKNSNLNVQFFPSAKLNSANQCSSNSQSGKNSSKINAILTAESSPNQKVKQQTGIIGSQTHRVTPQGNICKKQLQKKFESNSKDNLNKMLSPINPFLSKKEISDNLLLQIQTMKQQSSLSQKQQPMFKSTLINQQKIINQLRRSSKQPQFRKSLEQNSKIQQRPLLQHQHTNSDINTEPLKQN